MWSPVLLVASALLAIAAGACHSTERDYYEELGCTPETVEGGGGCPASYDCSSLSKRSGEKCYYAGKAYDGGHKLETTPATACLAECRCGSNQQTNNKMAFTCISIECPELFIGPPPPGCYRTYEHGKCCYVKEICGDTPEQKTPKVDVCQYKGQTYKEGEKFYPEEEPCLTCTCQSGFNGSLVEPFCRKAHCNIELHYGHHIAGGCVPIYYGEKGCCPIDWRCPEPSDKVVASEGGSKSAPKSGKTCKFGDLTMHVGDRLSPSAERGERTECSCRVPPHPICIQQESS